MASSDTTTKLVKLFGVYIPVPVAAPPPPLEAEQQLIAELEPFGSRIKNAAPAAMEVDERAILEAEPLSVIKPVEVDKETSTTLSLATTSMEEPLPAIEQQPIEEFELIPRKFDEEASTSPVLEAEPLSVIMPLEFDKETSTTISLATAMVSSLPLETENNKEKRKTLAPPHPQELPREYMDVVASIGGDVEGSLTLILGKSLTATDMNKNHNRLLMPQGKIKKPFLNPEEEVAIHIKRPAGKRDLYDGVPVRVVDPSMKERTMSLARWNSKKKGWWFALKKDWIKMATDNNLHDGEAVQIWSFRFKADGRLGFVLHKVLAPPPANEDDEDVHRRKKTKRTVGETSTTIASGPSRLN